MVLVVVDLQKISLLDTKIKKRIIINNNNNNNSIFL
jgi:hypothetical protein